MTRVVVIGAHGRIGLHLVRQLLKRGEDVVATIRNPRHMPEMVGLGAETHLLDLDTSPLEGFVHAMSGADAVIFAAGSAEGEPSTIDRKGVQRTVRAAANAKTARYIAISALGATTAVPPTYDWPGMKEYYAAKRTANRIVRNSSLFWTIIEPGTLTEARPAGRIALTEGEDIKDRKIARADVAATVLAVLGEPRTVGHVFQLVGGTTAIGDAVRAAVAG